ncbi:MAG TPA: ribose-5-phosphate isomerase RpiA [Thermoplasmata archaeon]|nr:ribose-5-phosphate isomerase RpiA [Thermoplasmata archaeon]
MAGDIGREKLAAARAAAALVRPGMRVALGTGSTADLAIRALGERPAGGARIVTVASSPASEQLARDVGLAVEPLGEGDRFDLMVDGADEVSPALDLTKGGGGALFREKLLARHSRELVIAVDRSKLVDRLGQRSPIPIEIVPFARPAVLHHLREQRIAAAPRSLPDGGPWITANGNELLDLDLRAADIDIAKLDRSLHALPGVVETGLFLGMAHRVFIGRSDGTAEERVAPRAA